MKKAHVPDHGVTMESLKRVHDQRVIDDSVEKACQSIGIHHGHEGGPEALTPPINIHQTVGDTALQQIIQ